MERINKRSRRYQADKDSEDQLTGKRFFNRALGQTMIRVNQGNCYVTDKEDEILTTVLGSCISACIHDPVNNIGGMNHFMLPISATESGKWSGNDSLAEPHLRYGNFAMEKLINDLLKRGSEKKKLIVKIFGGGNVMNIGTEVGHRNADFAEEYFKAERMRIVAQDTKGTQPRKLQFFPTTGKVRIQKLDTRHSKAIAQRDEKSLRQSHVVKDEGGSIELWD